MNLPKLANNIEGEKHGMLTAIEFVGSSNGAVWSFRCDCGKLVNKKASIVTKGHVKSCGCLSKATRFSGGGLSENQVVGMITAIRAIKKVGHNILWDCCCQCGNSFSALASNVLSGNTKSCGCHRRIKTSASFKVHGLSGTRSYWQWANMMSRCYNVNDPAYSNYGGRGIGVCDEWHEVSRFYMDMGEKPAAKSMDRVNNELGYSPENCRWATRSEQGRNTRTNVFVVRDGQSRTIAEWSEITGIPSGRIYMRKRMGWADEELFLEKNPKR